MWLLVGLGNPGDKYAGNRHNVGFMVIDQIAEDYGFPAFRSKFQGLMSEGRIDGKKVVLLKPQTFMNESGVSVGKAAKYFKVTKHQTMIFHDELDLDPFKFRIKWGGGIAGHNGLRSISKHLGSPDYGRVRLGIGHPGDKNRVSGYVLSDFASEEKKTLEPYIWAVSKHVPLLLAGQEDDYMTRVTEEIKE